MARKTEAKKEEEVSWLFDVLRKGWSISFTKRFGGPPENCKAQGKNGICGKTRKEHRQMTHIFQEAK